MRQQDIGKSVIGIMGLGVAGEAVREHLTRRGCALRLYDAGRGAGSVAEINEAEIVFVCVPTPYSPGVGFDARAVEESVSALEDTKIVVITSTVLPGTTEAYQIRYPQHCFVCNPAFLREAHALDDYLHPDRQLSAREPSRQCAALHRERSRPRIVGGQRLPARPLSGSGRRPILQHDRLVPGRHRRKLGRLQLGQSLQQRLPVQRGFQHPPGRNAHPRAGGDQIHHRHQRRGEDSDPDDDLDERKAPRPVPGNDQPDGRSAHACSIPRRPAAQ
jgi:hypothetical protein